MIDRSKKPLPFDDEDFGDAFPSERPTSPNGEHAPEASGGERPTISPPFDLEEYARTSDSKLRASKPVSPYDKYDKIVDKVSLEKSTKPPPASAPIDFELEEGDLDSLDAIDSSPAFRPPQITLTDDDELETARLRSVLLPSEPPPARHSSRASALSMLEDSVSPPPTLQYPEGFEEKDPFSGAALNAQIPKGSINAPRITGTPPVVPSRGTATMNPSDAPAPGTGAGITGHPQASTRKAPLPIRDMNDRVSLGDYSGALEIAESILQLDPVNAEAIRCADECRATLQQMYTARIGPMDRVPMVMVPREQLRWLSIDHRAGFLLSHVDGVSSLEMILDVSGMPTLDALRILCELLQQRVISFR